MNKQVVSHTYATCAKCHAVNKILTERIASSTVNCGKCNSLLTFKQLVSETDEIGLQKIIEKSEIGVVVDFWAPWCGPCRGFAPTFEAVSKISEGKLVFLKVNTEKFPNISQRFNIRGIPTLIVFRNGKEVARESGAFPIETFKNWVIPFYSN
jgi:thioredoxin 2